MDGNDRRIVGLAGTAHALVHTYELSVPIMVGIWLTQFTTTAAELGAVVAVGMALFGIGALPGGVLADRYGSRTLIALCLTGMGGSFLVLSVAPSTAAGVLEGLPLLSTSPAVVAIAVALVLWGAAASVYHPAGLALISKGVSERGRGFALHGMAGNVGIAAGPLATTIMLAFMDWETVAAVLAVPAFVAAGAALLLDVDESSAADEEDVDDDAESPDSLGAFLRISGSLVKSSFAFVFVVVICSGLYYRGVLTFLPELLAGLETFQPIELAGTEQEPANYVYSGLLAVGVAGQYVGGRLTDIIAPARGIMLAFGGMSLIALVFMPLASAGAVPLLVISAVLGFALFTVQPMYQAAVAEYTPEAARGLSYGYTYLGVFGIGALGAGIAGTILTYGTPTALFVVLAVIAAVASAVGLLLMRR
ncbi:MULTISPECIES: MFS transporter [Halolamina]|uniref:Sugar phosphate permease n=1 Tax=Halolamina pelagica TaxID=699431 RepID=A0A1I5MN25_9EURY|nr:MULTISPECIES: MFS transporter [Halolamina]NHX36093.1 MFS transporter [Halolamina sp. R1-12]SFP10975.1 Sugar phosphate permease [Halolamina pelagica]